MPGKIKVKNLFERDVGMICAALVGVKRSDSLDEN